MRLNWKPSTTLTKVQKTLQYTAERYARSLKCGTLCSWLHLNNDTKLSNRWLCNKHGPITRVHFSHASTYNYLA